MGMMNKKFLTVSVGIIAVMLAAVSLLSNTGHRNVAKKQIQQVSPTSVSQHEDILTYTGQQGVDALTLLKRHAQVEISSSGLITSINGRKADDAQHEYWAFYINSKMATVGPAEYQTKDSDVLLWRIVKY